MSASRPSRVSRIMKDLSQLDSEEYLLVLEKILSLIKLGSSSAGGPSSVADLQGLGKELWAGIDVKEYLRQERD